MTEQERIVAALKGMLENDNGIESTATTAVPAIEPAASPATTPEEVELPARERFGHFRIPVDAYIKGLGMLNTSDK